MARFPRCREQRPTSFMFVALLIAALSALLLVGTWVLYPLAAFAQARLRPRPVRPVAHWRPGVSVILATREAPEVVRERVLDCLAVDYPSELLDVVIGVERGAWSASVDLGTDRTTVVEGDAPGGKACNLNAAVRAAIGEVLVFTDSYQRFQPDAISRLVAALGDPRFGVVSGSLELPGEQTGQLSLVERYWLVERRLRDAEARTASTVGVTGAIYAMRRRMWEPLPAGVILDDLFGPMRIALSGKRVGFVAEARATDVRVAQPEREYGRKVRTLTGNFQLCAWLPGVLLPWRNPLWLRFVWHKLMRLATPYLTMAFGVSALVALWLWEPTAVSIAVAAAVVMTLLVMWAPTSWLARLRETLRWGMAMQAATFSATLRGIRGRWDVWR